MSNLKRSRRHVFVILRVDSYDDDGASISRVSVNKVVGTEEVAKREVDRLNALNAEKGSRYYHEVAQLEDTE
jgi:hypothetical protein